MKTLVVIPTTKLLYETGFSAPSAWLFSRHAESVRGIFGFELLSENLDAYDAFVLELNWYTTYHEFGVIADYIKRCRPDAPILFGGLFASLMFREIFARHPVDYHIKGDNEEPMRRFLDGEDPRTIPNFVGRDFENETRAVFRAEDYETLEFNLDWFPSYFRELEGLERGDVDSYRLPMLVTGKGGCGAVHPGCEYCMGSQRDVLRKIYARKPVHMSNAVLLRLIERVEQRFDRYSIYIMNRCEYDFSGRHFKGHPHIEIDSRTTPERIGNLLGAFDSCDMILPVYEEGIMGATIIDWEKILGLASREHNIRFVAYTYDRERLAGIPKEHIIFNLDEAFAPAWVHWDVYSHFESAARNSKTIYEYFVKRGRRVFTP
jgi:hypothetical protein